MLRGRMIKKCVICPGRPVHSDGLPSFLKGSAALSLLTLSPTPKKKCAPAGGPGAHTCWGTRLGGLAPRLFVRSVFTEPLCCLYLISKGRAIYLEIGNLLKRRSGFFTPGSHCKNRLLWKAFWANLALSNAADFAQSGKSCPPQIGIEQL